MPQPLRVLIVEDNLADAELILSGLLESGFAADWKRVDTEEAFQEELGRDFEIVLCDYNMPRFSGPRALEILRESGRDIPLILVSGSISEEAAVEAIKLGASDYLLKDRLARLGAAVTNALAEGSRRRERVRTEAGLRESDRRFQEMLENVALIAITVDQEGRTTFCNDFLLGLTGWTREEVIGHSWFDRFMPEGPGKESLRAMVAGGTVPAHHQNPIRTRDGRAREIAWNNTPLRDQDGRIIGTASIGEDVTDRWKAEADLRESEARFRQVVENIHEVFWMSDPFAHTMLYVSPVYEGIWGRTCQSLYDTPGAWLNTVRPEDRERVAQAEARQAAGGYDEEYRIIRPDGTERWIRDRAFPVRGAGGAVERVVGVAEDITARKNLNEQFLRAQRMEAIGTLASGVAHDLNNVLAPIMMAPGLLREFITGERELKLLSLIEQGAHRGAQIVRQLLTFSRGSGGERVRVQLRHLLKEMTEIMRETFPREIEVSSDFDRELRPVRADPTQLHQVLMNLCVNARDAMPHGGTLSLVARNADLSAADVALHPPAKPGPYVCVSVVDTGIGIPPEIAARIFDPFFTTKALTKGTGLGLSTVLGIVRSHEGFIALTSAPGRGTTFTVSLPAAPDRPEDDEDAVSAALPRGHGELVLVVDDEEPVRTASRLVLEQNGYRVLTAVDGAEGLATFVQNREAVRVVLTDVMMPVMGGVTLIRALRAMAPRLLVLATSGLGDTADHSQLTSMGVDRVLTKPCGARDLLVAVQSLLHAPR